MSSLSVLLFCFRSLWTEYGWFFLTRVVLKHPVQTWRGIREYGRSDPGDTALVSKQLPEAVIGTRPPTTDRKVLGLGFCLKPLAPGCPSGRANHSCLCLERGGQMAKGDAQEACRDCLIRSLGSLALRAGFDLYIMTSAQDILWDILLPAMEKKQYTFAVMTLCRYSFEPIRIALAVTGLRGCLLEFAEGECQSYSAWRSADKGRKSERTRLRPEDQERLLDYFSPGAGNIPFPEVERKRNIYTLAG